MSLQITVHFVDDRPAETVELTVDEAVAVIHKWLDYWTDDRIVGIRTDAGLELDLCGWIAEEALDLRGLPPGDTAMVDVRPTA